MEAPDSLPTLLWVETALALPGVVLGLVPWLLFSETALRAPPGYDVVGVVAGLALVLLWPVLLVHLVVDGWNLLRHGPARLTGRGGVHVGFRTVESLGALAVPLAFQWAASGFGDGPPASGAAAFGALFVVLAVVAGTAVVVLLHAGWLLGSARVGTTARRTTL